MILAENISIREATINDIELILRFIKELACYEKLEHEVVANQAILKDSLFGEKKYAEVIFAEINSKPVGFALYFHNFSTFLGRPGIYIEDLYVRQEFRNKGIGKALFKHLAQMAKELNFGRIEWWVLKWNPARKFYDTINAKAMQEWIVYRLCGEALDKIAK